VRFVTTRPGGSGLGGGVGMSRHPTLGRMDAGDPLGLIEPTGMDAAIG
jgi:hypothetical protein